MRPLCPRSAWALNQRPSQVLEEIASLPAGRCAIRSLANAIAGLSPELAAVTAEPDAEPTADAVHTKQLRPTHTSSVLPLAT